MDFSSIDCRDIADVATLAGREVMEVYGGDFETGFKEDNSPLTEADRRSNEIILRELRERYPDIPVISEESKATAYHLRKNWELFWLVDPLDGTKEFVKRNGEFTVNIALVRGQEPVLGVVFVPARDTLYYAAKGQGSFRREKANGDGSPAETQIRGQAHYRELDSVTVVASRSHLTPEVEAFVEGLKQEGKHVEFLSAGSSLKICLVAEGKATVYPRLGPTMEWDTAAAHIVAIEAGKKVLDYETGEPLRYNKENLLNPWFMVE